MASVPSCIDAGAILPRIWFDRIDGPGRISWNQGTTATVVFVPHLDGCEGCDRYLEALGAVGADLREWATRALVLATRGYAGSGADRLYQLDDSTGEGRAQLGVDGSHAAVIQADRWGAVYQVEAVDSASHGDLPAPTSLVTLAKYIDIQCPECGVPSKEWLGASPFPLG